MQSAEAILRRRVPVLLGVSNVRTRRRRDGGAEVGDGMESEDGLLACYASDSSNGLEP